MTHATWPEGADMLARAGRHWGWIEDRELHPV